MIHLVLLHMQKQMFTLRNVKIVIVLIIQSQQFQHYPVSFPLHNLFPSHWIKFCLSEQALLHLNIEIALHMGRQ